MNRPTAPRVRRLTPTAALAVVLVLAPGLVSAATADTATSPASTTVTARMTSTRVEVHTAVYVSGRVTGGSRAIQVVEKLPSGWRVVGSANSVRNGGFRVQAPTRYYGRHVYAVMAPATSTHAAATSALQTVVVTPSYRPAGSASSWSYIRGPRERMRFDPCQVITYRVNARRGGKRALADVKGAFNRIGEASGMRFRYLGSTNATPRANRTGQWPEDANIVIAWQDRKKAANLGSWAGVGGPELSMGGARDALGAVYETQKASVLLAADLHLAGGFGTGPRHGFQGTRGQLLMHEITHALGGGHTSGQGQIMEPVMDNDPARFGAGDLTLLSRIGMASGCMITHAGE